MELPAKLRDTVVHGSYRYPFAIHETTAESDESLLMLYLHWHEEAELLLVDAGDVNIRINDRTFRLREGEVAYIPPYALHACYKGDSNSASFLALVFRPEVIAPERRGPLYETYLAPVERGDIRLPEHLTHDDDWQEHVIRLVRESRLYEYIPYDQSDLMLRSILFGIWSELYLHAEHSTKPQRAYSRLEPVMKYMYTNYQHPITIEDLAAQVNLSVSRFSALFRKEFHSSPVAHLLKYRLHQSCILLQATDTTVAEIAFACGFENLSNFNRQFREQYGCTPTAYRNDARAIREEQTHIQDERSRMFETWMHSSETKKETSNLP